MSPLISYPVVTLGHSNQSSSDMMFSAQGSWAGLGGGGVAVGGDDGCHGFSISAYGDPSMCPGPPLALCITLKPIKTNTLMGSHSYHCYSAVWVLTCLCSPSLGEHRACPD